MRLINTTSFKLEEFVGDPTNPRFPRYAILSHTWEQEEVTFQDIQNLDVARTKAGFSKISKCCEIAIDEGLKWAWVDTCCIDKSNNSELTEAINSMFKWYEAATICYAYLSDVGDIVVAKHSDWRDSRWFTRGWTLQELVSPFEVIIYDCVWKEIGTKRRLTKELEGKTDIPEEVLLYAANRRKHSIAARMSWAKGRQTTRMEDRAYSLLGLFDIVNMPLVYGEGKKAFSRLHQEIMNIHQDDTIFMGGLGFLDSELSTQSVDAPETTMYGQGFLITPDSVPAQLPTRVHPLPNTFEKSHLTTHLVNQVFTSEGISGTWERKDPKLRGDILSVHLRIIQVVFSSYGPASIPITQKKQQIELDPQSRKLLEDFDVNGFKAMGGSLCLAMFRCGATDGRLLARYFLCFLANNELWAYPTAVYRYVTPAEVYQWPYLPCQILLSGDAWKPYPLLEPLRDVAGWGSEPQLNGAFRNGWTWDARTTENTEDFINDPKAGLIKKNTHFYQLRFDSPSRILDLAITLRAIKNISQEPGITDVEIEIELRCPTASEPDIQSVKLNPGDREGLVTQLCHRLDVSGGSAELVISIYYGVDGGTHCYSPMMRFRAFEASDKEQVSMEPEAS
ncbi:heterokaryon incompatibility protein-domain-containing protein [Xylaria flabelliformis]|nr:heterokaryon incompatibility protein-domain-containing protein [Xylaria flabelliformis]